MLWYAAFQQTGLSYLLPCVLEELFVWLVQPTRTQKNTRSENDFVLYVLKLDVRRIFRIALITQHSQTQHICLCHSIWLQQRVEPIRATFQLAVMVWKVAISLEKEVWNPAWPANLLGAGNCSGSAAVVPWGALSTAAWVCACSTALAVGCSHGCEFGLNVSREFGLNVSQW